MVEYPIYNYDKERCRIDLHSPTLLPKASAFLWNKQMLIQLNCRGYANSQFMQPEPAKYSYGPNIEEKTFMQPEPNYYAHHPGRFFYIKNEDTGEIFSAPYEPTRQKLDSFKFSVGLSDVEWHIEKDQIEIKISLTLSKDEHVEFWHVEMINRSLESRNLSIYPFFSIGYMSWMNQSATYHPELNAIVASSIRPYQKLKDYYKQRDDKQRTFLLSKQKPDAYCASQPSFEGEGGLALPDQIQQEQLSNNDSQYEVPAAVLQFKCRLKPSESFSNQLIFGPAKSVYEIGLIRKRYFKSDESDSELNSSKQEYQAYIKQGKGCLEINTPNENLNQFVNHWLPRQMFYHGDVNRLTSDPQTRNYLQDNMGMSYIKPDVARKAFIHSISQQLKSGAMPDGILLRDDAELKYINQIPHTDHSVWLPICLAAYLDETNDYEILEEQISYQDGTRTSSLAEGIDAAMEWLIENKDHRGLSLIEQGDWCDPMNMVGHKGKGVSAWLTMATSYALKVWSGICEHSNRSKQSSRFEMARHKINNQVNRHFWDKNWYARGITDDGISFGVETDTEGSLYLNPQSWAMMSEAANEEKIDRMLFEIETRLNTPYGPMMLSPAYTKMREDVGRLTQKSPGVSENGSIYNHAAVFYAFSLYQTRHKQKAFEVLSKMLPTEDSALRRGQLPNYIPNYYRGAAHQYPEHAGRSSQLFNTGTISWYYRCLIEGLFGLKGCGGDLIIAPNLPKEWDSVSVTRRFMGAIFEVSYHQSASCEELEVFVNDKRLDSNVISHIEKGQCYLVTVNCPKYS